MKAALAPTLFIGFISGIALASLVPVPLPILLFMLLLAAAFACAWFFGRRDAYVIPALFLLCAALGAGRMLLVPRELPAPLSRELGSSVSLTGTIAADPDVRETNQRLTVDVAENGAQAKVLAVADRYPQFSVGDTVTVSGALSTPEPFATDGGRMFDYRMYLAKDGVLAMIAHAHVERTGTSKNVLFAGLRAFYGAKHAFARALEDALPEPYASLAEGLITGGKQGLGNALLDAFTIAGLLPIVVLSGYNVMIVADAVLAGFSFLKRRIAVLLAGICVALFVVAAGGGASALRAALMAGLALYARASGRTYDALRALVAVFVVMLLINPLSLLYDPGFQFSFAATLGLILLSSSMERWLIRIRPASLREIIATSLSAQLFVLPLLLYQTGNLSLVSLPANMLVLPVIPLAMGLSAIAGAVSLLSPALAPLIGLPAYAVLRYIVSVAEGIARVPLAHFIVPAFPALLLIPAYLLLAWLVRAMKKAAPAASRAPVPVPIRERPLS